MSSSVAFSVPENKLRQTAVLVNSFAKFIGYSPNAVYADVPVPELLEPGAFISKVAPIYRRLGWNGYRLRVVLLESGCLKISADPFIDPVAGFPRQNTAHKSDVSTALAKLQLHARAKFISLGDSIRCHERIIHSVQDQSGCFDVFYEGTAAGTTIVIINAVKAV